MTNRGGRTVPDKDGRKSFEFIFDSFFHGKYKWSEFLNLDISSECERIEVDGREVFKCSEKLKAFHKFINKVIFDNLNVDEESVYSYRKGVNVKDALKKHVYNGYFFQTDINDFFNSINENDVREALLCGDVDSFLYDYEDYIDVILKCVTYKGKVPVGFSTSPVISNSILYGFDISLKEICGIKGLEYSRYCDDIIISGKDKDVVNSSEDDIKTLLLSGFEGRLSLNKFKSKRKSVYGKASFLGLVINSTGNIVLNSSLRMKVETLIYLYLADREKFSDYAGSYEEGVKYLKGIVKYINSIDDDYMNKLRRKFGVTIIDMILKGEIE